MSFKAPVSVEVFCLMSKVAASQMLGLQEAVTDLESALKPGFPKGVVLVIWGSACLQNRILGLLKHFETSLMPSLAWSGQAGLN